MTELEMMKKMLDRIGAWYKYDEHNRVLLFGSYEGVEITFDEKGNAIELD